MKHFLLVIAMMCVVACTPDDLKFNINGVEADFSQVFKSACINKDNLFQLVEANVNEFGQIIINQYATEFCDDLHEGEEYTPYRIAVMDKVSDEEVTLYTPGAIEYTGILYQVSEGLSVLDIGDEVLYYSHMLVTDTEMVPAAENEYGVMALVHDSFTLELQ